MRTTKVLQLQENRHAGYGQNAVDRPTSRSHRGLCQKTFWRIASSYADVCIFDIESNSELHELISTLPLFSYMDITVRQLCRHPLSIRDADS
ncbi:muconolactone Delta-isomerase [Vreelandella populi]|uniref:muconolactone Delta-isomerase n=1 Tax=Vreelandella populi TaxID=2498858 RepID=UPI000F8E92C8|nr:muconolactone Delta-isomerase family protein [Halomonas populi]RUR54290.1 hypothetical protein ELY40_08215 [Halomonas populi]